MLAKKQSVQMFDIPESAILNLKKLIFVNSNYSLTLVLYVQISIIDSNPFIFKTKFSDSSLKILIIISLNY